MIAMGLLKATRLHKDIIPDDFKSGFVCWLALEVITGLLACFWLRNRMFKLAAKHSHRLKIHKSNVTGWWSNEEAAFRLRLGFFYILSWKETSKMGNSFARWFLWCFKVREGSKCMPRNFNIGEYRVEVILVKKISQFSLLFFKKIDEILQIIFCGM